MNEIRYFSMFSGVGGFEIGLARASNPITQSKNEQPTEGRKRTTDEQGTLLHDRSYSSFTCVGMSEYDKYSSQVLKYRFPNIKNWGDCTKIDPRELPDFDMLCGGFPCQAFSIAGKRRGFEDTRGTMFFEVARILEVKRPKIVLLENVKGLLNHNKGETFSVILQTLDELGYEVQWMVLNSKFFGVPQNRERVFIIGNLRGERRPEILPFGRECGNINETGEGQLSSTITSTYWKGWGGGRTAIQEIKVEGMLTEDGWDKRHENIRRVYSPEGISPTIPTGTGGGVMSKIAIPVLTPDRPEKRQNGRRFKEDGEPSFTLTGQDIHGVAIMDLYNNKEHTDRCPALTEPHHNTIRVREGFRIRRLTPVECCRLQGFPDDWNDMMSDTQRYKQMGNAVTTNVVKAIGEKLWLK